MEKVGFIFDLDGVIVDTAKYHFLAWRNLANSLNIDFTEAQNEQLKGVSRIKSLEKILSWGNIQITEDKFIALMAQKNQEYLSFVNKMDASEILPDVPKIMDFLVANEVPIALGSASKNAISILRKIDMYELFDAIVDGNAVSKAKPDPEVFLRASDQLGVRPENSVVFEDSVAGVQAANRAGMLSIGIGSQEVLHEADYVFKDFTEISLDFINQILKKEVSIS